MSCLLCGSDEPGTNGLCYTCYDKRTSCFNCYRFLPKEQVTNGKCRDCSK